MDPGQLPGSRTGPMTGVSTDPPASVAGQWWVCEGQGSAFQRGRAQVLARHGFVPLPQQPWALRVLLQTPPCAGPAATPPGGWQVSHQPEWALEPFRGPEVSPGSALVCCLSGPTTASQSLGFSGCEMGMMRGLLHQRVVRIDSNNNTESGRPTPSVSHELGAAIGSSQLCRVAVS